MRRWRTRRRLWRMRREAMRLVILSELNQMGAKQPGLVAPRDALGRINAQCIWRWPDGSTYTAHMN